MPKIIDHQRYREELLLRSFPLFGKHGYSGLTTRELARALDVSTGTLYHYFPNKEALFEQMIELLMRQHMDVKQDFHRQTMSMSTRMKAMAQMFRENREQQTMQARLCFDYCRYLQQEGRDPREFWKRVKPQFQDLTKLVLGNDDPHLHGFMITVIQGILVRFAWDDDPPPDLEQIFTILGRFAESYEATSDGRREMET